MTNTNEMITMSLQELIDRQSTERVSRKGNYEEFGSKKKLEDAKVLDESVLKMVKEIKGTFNFALHNSKKYLIVTLYNKTDKYRFVVIDLATLTAVGQPSIKIAKKFVDSLVATEVAPVEEVKEEEAKEEVVEEKKEKSSKKRKENK